ncbi:unnamed protein product [Scytosiphon promiscuus]
MQFEPEESGEERRRRQKDYHDFLDAQVEARKKHQPAANRETDALDGGERLPVLPLSARLRYHPRISPYDVNPTAEPAKYDRKGLSLNESSSDGLRGRNHEEEIRNRDELLGRLEQRLEAEVQRRYLVERKLAVVSQKLDNWMADSNTSLTSLGARDAVVTEVREQTRNLDSELARMREWQKRVDATLNLTPKVQEMTQQQVKALEEEARTRIQADEGRSTRFRQAVERVSSEVENLARRLEAEERTTLQRVAKMEAAFAREATGAREATKQLGAEVQGLEADVSGSAKQMSSLLQSLRLVEKLQQEQYSAATETKNARNEREQLREQLIALNAAVSGSESKMTSLLQGLRMLERWQQEQQSSGAARPEGQVPRQQIQASESLMAATSVKLDLLRTSLANELSELMGDTAKRAVESTNVPQLMTALRGRVELVEGRINSMADKSLRALEDELSSVRLEVTRLEGRIDAGPIAAGLKVLAVSTKSSQAATQSQLTELQDALSAEITARRRNAVRLAEAQAAIKEGGRESAVQAVSGLRARCLELEELVARLTREIQAAQEELSSQTHIKLAATQERNSRALGKLEESLAGESQVAQQGDDEDRSLTKVVARIGELEALIIGNKDMLRETEEKSRVTFAAMDAKRQEQAQHFADKMACVASGEMVRIEAIERDMREQGLSLKEAFEAGQQINRKRSDGIHDELKTLEGRLRTLIADSQEDGSTRVSSLLQQTQEQVNRDITRIRQTADRNVMEINALRGKINAEETARMDGEEGIHRELSKAAEACQSRVRLWAEERLRKERAATEESLERAHAESEMVRTLLDEAVKAVSKELEILRAESRATNVALEDSLQERTSELEARLTEVDDGAVKQRRVSELTKETGARIGEVERRVRQVDQELKRELEVKLALSSLVCAVADKASMQRLEQTSSIAMQLEKTRKAGAVKDEASLKAELQKTNATVARMQSEINAGRGWQISLDDLEVKLVARIEELKALAEAAESTAAIAKVDASAALETGEKNSLALKDAAKQGAHASSSGATAGPERAADAEGAGQGQGGQPAKKAPAKKVLDFTAMNDELEAEDSPSPSPASSSRSQDTSDEDDNNKNDDEGESDLQPRVAEIEEELITLKQRLEDGMAAMDVLRLEFLNAGSAVSTSVPMAQSASSRDKTATGASGSRGNTDGEQIVAVDERLRPSSRAAKGRPESGGSPGVEQQKARGRVSKQVPAEGKTDDDASSEAADPNDNGTGGSRRQTSAAQGRGDVNNEAVSSPDPADASRKVPLSPTSSTSYTPPLSPTSGASYTPPLSPKSDMSDTADQSQGTAIATESQDQDDPERSGTFPSPLCGRGRAGFPAR